MNGGRRNGLVFEKGASRRAAARLGGESRPQRRGYERHGVGVDRDGGGFAHVSGSGFNAGRAGNAGDSCDAGCGIGTGAEGVGPALHFGSEGSVALGRPDARDGRHGRLCPDVQPIRGRGVGGDGTRLFCGKF